MTMMAYQRMEMSVLTNPPAYRAMVARREPAYMTEPFCRNKRNERRNGMIQYLPSRERRNLRQAAIATKFSNRQNSGRIYCSIVVPMVSYEHATMQ